MAEQWKDIREFPGYIISNYGNIENAEKKHHVPTRLNRQGFVMVNLWDGFTQKTRSVAILVADAFLDPPKNEYYNSIIHLNNDRTDCYFENLMWRPRWYALKYRRMFEQEPIQCGVYIADTDETFDLLRDACVKYGLAENDVYLDMQNNRRVFHYDWDFLRLEE